jgi:hypothetical protein
MTLLTCLVLAPVVTIRTFEWHIPESGFRFAEEERLEWTTSQRDESYQAEYTRKLTATILDGTRVPSAGEPQSLRFVWKAGQGRRAPDSDGSVSALADRVVFSLWTRAPHSTEITMRGAPPFPGQTRLTLGQKRGEIQEFTLSTQAGHRATGWFRPAEAFPVTFEVDFDRLPLPNGTETGRLKIRQVRQKD